MKLAQVKIDHSGPSDVKIEGYQRTLHAACDVDGALCVWVLVVEGFQTRTLRYECFTEQGSEIHGEIVGVFHHPKDESICVLTVRDI